jgi:AraC-like DNA-binding protein
MPMSKTRIVLVSERARWPRAGGAPHPQLQPLLARDYTSFTDFTEPTAPPHDIVIPATAAIGVILKLKDSSRLPLDVIAGAHDTFWGPEVACPTAYMELWLAPLGAYRLLGLPIHTLSDHVVDLTDVLGTGIRRLADRLRETPSRRQQFALLDAYLLRRAQDGPQPAPEVAWAWHRLTATGGRLPISRLAGEVGWSHKHLITRFRQQIGLPPKTAARLARFDAVWRRLSERPSARWDQLAADSGYADQAHLIRDFHQFTGASPAAFLARPQAHTAVPAPA